MGFVVDGLTPKDVIRPRSVSEISSFLREADRDRRAVIPWGGGTRIGVGNVPKAYDSALDLSGFGGNMEHVAGDMTVVCDADVRVAELDHALREQGQRLPFKLPHATEATIGGSVASNAPNRMRPMFGAIRDWIIGMRVVLADGTETKSGGRVVKNVQGFDLHRLHTGAFGTLGVIVEIAIKLVPVARSSRTVALWFDQPDAASEAARQISLGNLNVETARMYVGGRAAGMIRELAADRYMDSGDESQSADSLMLVRLAGSERSLERQTQELTGLAGTVPALGYERLERDAEEEAWDYLETPINTSEFHVQLALKPADSIGALHILKNIANQEESRHGFAGMVDVGYGSVAVALENPAVEFTSRYAENCLSTARRSKGTALIQQCPVDTKKKIDVFCIREDTRSIMTRMKREFDPHRVLNPGRFAFRI